MIKYRYRIILRFIINGRGGFKDFEKLLNGGGDKIKRKETKLRLSLLPLLTSLNIGITSILWSHLQ